MSNAEQQDVGATIQRLVGELEQTRLGSRLRDPEFLRRHAVEALLRNPDPVMREVGQQVRDGTMTLRDVLRSDEYVQAFVRAGRRAQQTVDPRKLAEDLAALVTRARAQEQEGEGDETRRPGDDPPAPPARPRR